MLWRRIWIFSNQDHWQPFFPPYCPVMQPRLWKKQFKDDFDSWSKEKQPSSAAAHPHSNYQRLVPMRFGHLGQLLHWKPMLSFETKESQINIGMENRFNVYIRSRLRESHDWAPKTSINIESELCLNSVCWADDKLVVGGGDCRTGLVMCKKYCFAVASLKCGVDWEGAREGFGILVNSVTRPMQGIPK